MIVAIVPAAGLSRRMGQPKLVLDVRGEPLLARVIRGLIDGGADRVVVVAPPSEQPGSSEIVAIAHAAGASVETLAVPTPDMRSTLQRAFDTLGADVLGVMIAPADSVGMSAGIVRSALRRFVADPSRIVVPIHGARRGHPLILPASLTRSIRDLPPDQGINMFVRLRQEQTTFVEVDDPDFADDLDTPEDYRRIQEAT